MMVNAYWRDLKRWQMAISWSPLAEERFSLSTMIDVFVGVGSNIEPDVRIGAALTELRAANILVIGSGNLTHNLGEMGRGRGDDAPAPWAADFAEWVHAALYEGRLAELVGPTAHKQLWGRATAAFAAAQAGAGYAMSALFGMWGSYTPLFTISGMALALGLLLVLMSRGVQQRRTHPSAQ